ncbi:MAG: acyltransferase family protein [Mesorhizobium sp.]|nr:acyltransferase family protein [Mesorhizobium sp.]
MAGNTSRIGWVDTAKGICIIMVVMVHATLGVEAAAGEQGWMHLAVAWARPFRMPDFFLISGLFLGLVIDRPWLRYLDRKVVHFAYFYVLWLAIQFAFKAPGIALEQGAAGAVAAYLFAFVQPFGTLWFVYLLPIFFVFTRAVRSLPVWFVLLWAATMEILPVRTGSITFDEFCGRYVYFFAGYALAAHVFTLADWFRANPARVLAALAVWAPINALFVFTPAPFALAAFLQPDIGDSGAMQGIAELPFVSLLLGSAGLIAVVAIAVLLSELRNAAWLNWLGAHSIVVYLAFFLPMAATRVVLLKTGIVTDIGTISLITTIAAVTGPVVFYGLVQWSGYGRFLFERPDWAHIDTPAKRQVAAA